MVLADYNLKSFRCVRHKPGGVMRVLLCSLHHPTGWICGLAASHLEEGEKTGDWRCSSSDILLCLENKTYKKRFNKFWITYDTFNLHLNCKHNLKIWTNPTQTCNHRKQHKTLFTISLEDQKIKTFKSVVDLHWETTMLYLKNSGIETLGRNMLAGCKNAVNPSKMGLCNAKIGTLNQKLKDLD